jgi:hypothetical protein
MVLNREETLATISTTFANRLLIADFHLIEFKRFADLIRPGAHLQLRQERHIER